MGVLFVFIDGLGIGSSDPVVNPLAAQGRFPFLTPLLTGPGATDPGRSREVPWMGRTGFIVAADAGLGVPGIPQSATGQATILTGLNAAAFMGRHVSAFPTGHLKTFLEQRNILSLAVRAGRRTTFLNMFRPDGMKVVLEGTRPRAATTTAALAAGLRLRTLDDLIRGRAVYHDITCWTLAGTHYDVPLTDPSEAAERALRVTREHDLCLFEYFLTDFAGHSRERELSMTILSNLDAFLGAVASGLDEERETLVLTSDHGNVEDLEDENHSLNPVPLAAFGRSAAETVQNVRSISEVAGRLASLAGIPGVPRGGAALDELARRGGWTG